MSSIKEREEVPAELMALVDNLQKFIKQQKMIREENCCQRFSIEPIIQVETEMDENTKVKLRKIEVELNGIAKMVETLKKETREVYGEGELAYRLIKSGTVSLFNPFSEATAYNVPSVDRYFQNMINKFEDKIKVYWDQIKDLETNLNNLNKPNNPEELYLIIKKQHEILIGLAAQLYQLQDTLAKQKECMGLPSSNLRTLYSPNRPSLTPSKNP